MLYEAQKVHQCEQELLEEPEGHQQPGVSLVGVVLWQEHDEEAELTLGGTPTPR